MAVGMGVMVHTLVSTGEPQKIRIAFLIVFYATLVFAVIIPPLRGAMDQGFDASPFVVFPIRRLRLYAITVAAGFAGIDHVMYYPMLVAVAITGIFIPGVNAITGLLLIALCVLFFVVASNALTLGHHQSLR